MCVCALVCVCACACVCVIKYAMCVCLVRPCPFGSAEQSLGKYASCLQIQKTRLGDKHVSADVFCPMVVEYQSLGDT